MRNNIFIVMFALSLVLAVGGCSREDTGAYERALQAYEADDLDTALKEFSNAASYDERRAEGYRGEGLVYLKRGAYETAVKFFDMSLDSVQHENAEFTEDVLFYKAEAQEMDSKYEDAAETYASLTSGKRASEAYALMGRTFLKREDGSAADTAFQNAIAEEPGYAIFLLIYDAYCDAGREGDGAAYLETALTLDPETPSDYMMQGQVYTFLEDYQSARESLGIAIDRGNEEAIPILGYICLLEGDIASAKNLYQKVLDGGKNDAAAFNGLAMTALAEGAYEDALSYVRMGLNCNDETMNESLLYNQIVIYEKELDFEMARRKTEEFLKRYPENTEMKSEYKFLNR